MTGPFRNPRIATLFVVFLVHVVVQQIDGYPRDWWQLFKVATTNGYHPAPVLPIYGGHRRLPVSAENDYSSSHQGDVYQAEWMKIFDDGEDDDDNVNMNDRIGNVEDDAPENTKTNVAMPLTQEAITQLINDAVDKRILLSPQEWDETHLQNRFKVPDDEGMSASVKKVRSLRGPPRKPSPTTESNMDDRIHFADSQLLTPRLEARTLSVPACENTKFCTNKTNYPSDSEIKEALKKYYLPPVVDPPLIAQRMVGSDDKDALCQLERLAIKPISGLDNTNTWRIIFNNDEYVQTVNVEICSNLDQPCANLEKGRGGYPTKCVQKYIYRHLVGLGPNGTTELLPFEMPSSCCCQLILPSD